MGEIIKDFHVRSSPGEKPRRLKLLFDTGSLHSFVKQSAVRGMRSVLRLSKPREFGALGDGRFPATHLADLEVKFLGFWCLFPAYVVADSVLEKSYDVLAGAFFMQAYHIKLDPRRHAVILDPSAIQFSQRVRSSRFNPSFSSLRPTDPSAKRR